MKILRFILLLWVVEPLAGEIPSLATLAQRRYIVQNGGIFPGDDRTWRAEGGSGIWEWNIETGALSRVRPLSTHFMFGPYLDAAIAALDDRYVIHHRSMLEFDAATNRFLRRYDALAPEHGDWTFDGSAVSESAAKDSGVAAGYYGSFGCPSYDPGPGCTGTFPGIGEVTYHGARRFGPHVFHRPLDPSASTIALAKTFEWPDETVSVTFDPKRGRFWFVSFKWNGMSTASGGVGRFGYFPITGGAIGPAVVIETYEGAPIPRGILYDGPSDSILVTWQPDRPATRRPADLSRPAEPMPIGLRRFATLSGKTPERYEQVIPAVGHGPGANGTSWRSDVWFFNPSNLPVEFSLRRVGGAKASQQIVLPAHGSLELADALAQLGGGAIASGGDGVHTDALMIDSPYRWGEQLTVYSRTYTTSADGKGTYGQSVPAVPTRYGYSNNGTFVLDRREAGQFRHNIGIVNDYDEPLGVTLTFNYEHKESMTVSPRSVANLNVDRARPPHAVDVDVVEIQTARAVPVWLSMIDNKTGDGTFVPFSNLALHGVLDASIAIPQIANVDGAHGTRWRSDLYGEFEHWPVIEFTEQASFLVGNFYPSSPDGCAGQRHVVEKIPSRAGLYPDIASRITKCSSNRVMGALELHTASWMTGYSRTYTTREDGGTLGDILPLYPMGGWPVQHFSGIRLKDGFRINLGLYNGLDYPVVHRLLLYDASGKEVARRELTLDARRSTQAPLSDFVGHLPAGLYGMTVLPLDASERPGRSWAYVSIIDNATGDPTNLW